MAHDPLDDVLKRTDPAKRQFLRKILVGTAFAIPTVTSFTMDGLSVYDAYAQGSGNLSDRHAKEGFAPVDVHSVLARVARLPVQTWSYRGQDAAVRHIGPMAQDFAAAFGVGTDERHIHVLDAAGVALAAIQALAERVEAQQAELRALRSELRRREGSPARPAG
jgi:hypothetical protein